jgi:methionine aminopeptidase
MSPCPDDSAKLAQGNLVKIELGAHIDGYAAVAAHSIIVGGKSEGKQADVVSAAYNAFLAAQRAIKVGGTNHEVTKAIQAVCEEFEVEPL